MATVPAEFNFLTHQIALGLADKFRSSTARTLQLAGPVFRKIFEEYADRASNKAGLAGVNAEIAATMRAAVVTAYKDNVLRTAVPAYRTDTRYAGGRLLDALSSPTMAIGTGDGIGFIDTRLLDAQARQWQRLNFGAGPAEGSLPVVPARIQFGSNQGFTLGLHDGPRPNFRVPESPATRGYFLPGGQFYVGRFTGRGADGRFISRGDITTVGGNYSEHGIGARRFLDAGLTALAAEFVPAYRTYFEDVSRRALSGHDTVVRGG